MTELNEMIEEITTSLKKITTNLHNNLRRGLKCINFPKKYIATSIDTREVAITVADNTIPISNDNKNNNKDNNKNSKKKSINTTFLLTGIPILIIPTIIIYTICVIILKNQLQEVSIKEIVANSKYNSNVINMELNSDFNYLKSLTNSSILKDDTISKSQLDTYFNTEMNNKQYEYLAIIYDDTAPIVLASTSNGKNIYESSLKPDKVLANCITDAYSYNSTHYISLYAPIVSSDNTIVGSICAIKNDDKFTSLVNDLTISTNSKDVFIIDGTGHIISSTNESIEDKRIFELYDLERYSAVDEISSASRLDTVRSKSKTILGVSAIPDSNWIVITELDKSQLNGFVAKLIFVLILIIIVNIITTIIGFKLLAIVVSKPIKAIINRIVKLANLDLSESKNSSSLDYLKNSIELSGVADYILKAEDELRNFLNLNNSSVTLLETEATRLEATSESGLINMNQVTSTLVNIADGATVHAVDTESALQSVEKINELITENKQFLSKLIKENDSVIGAMHQGNAEIIELTNSSEKSKNKIDIIAEQVTLTSKSAQNITSVILTIDNIAKQTNMLALNASILAAKSNQEGAGFNVIASAIRKLSQDTSENSMVIKNSVTGLLSKIDIVDKNMADLLLIIDEQSNVLRATSNAFSSLEQSLMVTTQTLKDLQEKSNVIEGESDNVVSKMQNLAAVSEENAASTQEISATIQEHLSNLELITESTRRLKDNILETQAELSKFKY